MQNVCRRVPDVWNGCHTTSPRCSASGASGRSARAATTRPPAGAKVRQLGTFDTKRAALELAKSVAVGRAGSADETVETFIGEVWLKAKEGRVEQSTLDQYRWAVDRHIVPLIGAHPAP